MTDELKEGKDHLPRYLNVGEGSDALDKNLLQPLGKVDYTNTEAAINAGDINLSLAFEPVDWVSLRRDMRRTYDLLDVTRNYYTLKDFALTNQVNEQAVKLSEILPDNTVVLFDPTGDVDGSGIAERAIVIFGDPASPATMIALLHEVGHLKADPSNDHELKSSRDSLDSILGGLSPDQATIIIKDERDAWAFALKKLRPFFTKDGVFTKEKFLALMQRNLSGYASYISEKITQGVEAKETS